MTLTDEFGLYQSCGSNTSVDVSFGALYLNIT